MAKQEQYDEDSFCEELLELQLRRDEGEITEDEYAAQEAAVMARLRVTREHRQVIGRRQPEPAGLAITYHGKCASKRGPENARAPRLQSSPHDLPSSPPRRCSMRSPFGRPCRWQLAGRTGTRHAASAPLAAPRRPPGGRHPAGGRLASPARTTPTRSVPASGGAP